MDKYIDAMLTAKSKYFQEGVEKATLARLISDISHCYQREAENIGSSSSQHRLILILIIEKFKNSLIFERNLVNLVDSKVDDLLKKNDQVLGEIPTKKHPCGVSCQSNIESDQGNSSSSGCLVRPRRENFQKETSRILRTWLRENARCPYPSVEEKDNLSNVTGLSLLQINNWFANARRRILPSMTGGFTGTS